MIRPDKLIFGYVIFKISKEDIFLTAELLLKNNFTSKISSEGQFVVSASQKNKIVSLLEGRIKYSVGEIKGLYGSILKLRSRYGIIFALVLSIVLFLFLSGKVWDVRIESDDIRLVEQVKRELGNNGLYIGADWNNLSKSKIETAVLSESESVSWLNINRRGCVAYVSIIKKETPKLPEIKNGYANVIADRDCIIEDIIVKRGIPVVRVGESVKKGDLLISGIIPTELGGGFCYAEGEVRGRYTDQISVSVDAYETVKSYKSEYTNKITVSFFDFSINIFKRYRNLPSICDIIEEKSDFTLENGKKLPVTISKTKVYECSYDKRELSKVEMSKKALNLLKEKINTQLPDKDLLSISSSGAFTDKGYSMSADVVLRGSVTKITEFEFNSEK